MSCRDSSPTRRRTIYRRCSQIPRCPTRKKWPNTCCGLGAQPNDKPHVGSSALDACLWHLPWEDRNTFTSKQLASQYALKAGFDRIGRLLAAGAKWRPTEPDGMKSVRQMPCKCEPAVTVALMKLFAKYKAAPEELLEEPLDTPRMRGHLSRIGMKL